MGEVASIQLRPHHVTTQRSLPTLQKAIAQQPPARDFSGTGATASIVLVNYYTLQPSKTAPGSSTVGAAIVRQPIHMAQIAPLDIDVKDR